MNNSRGNRYSRDHQLIEVDYCSSLEAEEYWGFSFDEMGNFDQPALWKYV